MFTPKTASSNTVFEPVFPEMPVVEKPKPQNFKAAAKCCLRRGEPVRLPGKFIAYGNG